MNYSSKGTDSFKSRLRFYLFKVALRGNEQISKEEFMAFDIDQPEAIQYVDLYISEYQQFPIDHKVSLFNSKGITNNELYNEMKTIGIKYKNEIASWKPLYLEKVFQKKLTKSDFEDFKKVNHCGYCGLKKDEIKKMALDKKLFKKNKRGFNLELDRKSPNKEYSKENCIMACYWCNNAKTDEFTEEEFDTIGKAIGEVFRNRLAK